MLKIIPVFIFTLFVFSLSWKICSTKWLSINFIFFLCLTSNLANWIEIKAVYQLFNRFHPNVAIYSNNSWVEFHCTFFSVIMDNCLFMTQFCFNWEPYKGFFQSSKTIVRKYVLMEVALLCQNVSSCWCK